MTDLEWIKRFTKITVTKVCRDLGVDRANLINGRLNKDKEKLIRDKIIEEYNELNIKYKEELK